jgi:uncharacterized protein YidB (DUF937 family)
MGLLDDAVPGGNIAKPLLVALGVLLAGKMFAGRKEADNDAEPARDTRDEPSAIPDRRSPQADTPVQRDAGPRQGDGGILDGLGDLLDKISNNGQKDAADSWVKPAPRTSRSSRAIWVRRSARKRCPKSHARAA